MIPDVVLFCLITSSDWRYGWEKKQDMGSGGGRLSARLLPLKMNILEATGDAPFVNWRDPRPLTYRGSLACSTGKVKDKPRKFRVKIRFSGSYIPGCVAPNEWSIWSIVGIMSLELNTSPLNKKNKP